MARASLGREVTGAAHWHGRCFCYAQMGEFVSFVCIRADHQWGTADPAQAVQAGQVHSVEDRLAYCSDASLEAHERHEWRSCGPAPLATAAELAAHLATMESIAS